MINRKEYLINKYLDKSLSDQELDEINKLILLNEVSEEELLDYKNLVEFSNQIDKVHFEQKKPTFLRYRTTGYGIKRIPKFAKVAAVLIIGITIGVLIVHTNLTGTIQYVEVETKKGDKIQITLPGNNQVWLNSKSSIKYVASFSGANRVVELIGEAYFQFSEEDEAPILLKCDQTQILCNQGSININNDTLRNKVEIEVEKGWIALINPQFGNRQFIVESGFKGIINDIIPLWIEQNNDPNYLSWHTREISFNNANIIDVASTLSEVYDIQIDVKEDLKNCYFSRSYINEDLNSILKEIEEALDTQIKEENNTIIITGSPC